MRHNVAQQGATGSPGWAVAKSRTPDNPIRGIQVLTEKLVHLISNKYCRFSRTSYRVFWTLASLGGVQCF